MSEHKNADGQAIVGESGETPDLEGLKTHKPEPACSAPDIPPTMTCGELAERIKRGEKWKVYEPAPDEALIEEITEIAHREWAGRDLPLADLIKIAIREYIRRSAGREKG